MDYRKIIDKYYPAPSRLRDIFLSHSESVASLALEILERKNLPLEASTVEAAAMLHDIGIFMTDAPSIECRGTSPYILHGRLGADLLRDEGADETYARVAERHTGSGISPEEIETQHLPLPVDRTYMPESLMEKLICYADKFYSKSGDPRRKSYAEARQSIGRHSEEAARRFDDLHALFG